MTKPTDIADIRRFDAHCHLGFAENAAEVAAAYAAALEGVYSFTCTPDAFACERALCAPYPNLHVGLGLHPWWVKADPLQAQEQVSLFLEIFSGCREETKAYPPINPLPNSPWYIGEVGLDFTPKRVGTAENQLRAFEAIVAHVTEAAKARVPIDVMSIHSAGAVDETLAILKKYDVPALVPCVFHRFGGTQDQLRAVLAAGCFVSLGAQSLSTRRGRAYLPLIPRDQLLLETDLPAAEGQQTRAQDLLSALNQAALAL